MTTQVDIANRALLALGAKTGITDLSRDREAEARYVREVYDSTRDALLRSAHWGFARTMAKLTLLRTADGNAPWDQTLHPMLPWGFAYLMPDDCVAVRYVTARDGVAGLGLRPARYALSLARDTSSAQQRLINTDTADAVACYTQRVEVEDFWDDSFEQAMVFSLASQIALAVNGSMPIAQRMAQSAMQTLQAARVSDGNEGLIQTQRVPDWLAARGGGVDAMPEQTSGVTGWATPGFLKF